MIDVSAEQVNLRSLVISMTVKYEPLLPLAAVQNCAARQN